MCSIFRMQQLSVPAAAHVLPGPDLNVPGPVESSSGMPSMPLTHAVALCIAMLQCIKHKSPRSASDAMSDK